MPPVTAENNLLRQVRRLQQRLPSLWHWHAWYNYLMSTTSYLDRFLDPVTDAFTPELAGVIVNLRADAETEARINVLRQKANDGTLTPEEDADYKDFVEAVDSISIFQSKARRFLASRSV